MASFRSSFRSTSRNTNPSSSASFWTPKPTPAPLALISSRLFLPLCTYHPPLSPLSSLVSHTSSSSLCCYTSFCPTRSRSAVVIKKLSRLPLPLSPFSSLHLPRSPCLPFLFGASGFDFGGSSSYVSRLFRYLIFDSFLCRLRERKDKKERRGSTRRLSNRRPWSLSLSFLLWFPLPPRSSLLESTCLKHVLERGRAPFSSSSGAAGFENEKDEGERVGGMGDTENDRRARTRKQKRAC